MMTPTCYKMVMNFTTRFSISCRTGCFLKLLYNWNSVEMLDPLFLLPQFIIGLPCISVFILGINFVGQ